MPGIQCAPVSGRQEPALPWLPHANPVFVEVDGKPIRASKRSADWCLRAVDVCWNQKVKQTRESEKEAAAAAYDVARKAYRRILAESVDD